MQWRAAWTLKVSGEDKQGCARTLIGAHISQLMRMRLHQEPHASEPLIWCYFELLKLTAHFDSHRAPDRTRLFVCLFIITQWKQLVEADAVGCDENGWRAVNKSLSGGFHNGWSFKRVCSSPSTLFAMQCRVLYKYISVQGMDANHDSLKHDCRSIPHAR